MRFEAIRIQGDSLYNFIIETWNKPDSELKERIRSQIREAMESLGRKPDSYSVTIIRGDKREEKASREIPTLEINAHYLLFGFRESGGEPLSPGELEEEKAEIAEGLIVPKRSRIALVILQDSGLEAIVSAKPMPAPLVVGIAKNRNGW